MSSAVCVCVSVFVSLCCFLWAVLCVDRFSASLRKQVGRGNWLDEDHDDDHDDDHGHDHYDEYGQKHQNAHDYDDADLKEQKKVQG